MSTFEQLVAFGKEHPILAALYASLFTWGLTALGASLVFFFKRLNRAGTIKFPSSKAFEVKSTLFL